MRVPQSNDDLNTHFEEQLLLLESSAQMYDKGVFLESKRIAVSLRLLLHNTNSSHALMQQLDKINHKFISTAMQNEPSNFLSYAGLLGIVLYEDKSSKCVPMLDEVLTVSNQDGGAHVDPNIDEKFAELTRNNSLKWFTGNSKDYKPIVHPELPAIRQIAHEVLRTLKPYKEKIASFRDGDEGVFLAEFKANIGGLTPVRSFQKPERNEACPCGSGKKYKKCHGNNLIL